MTNKECGRLLEEWGINVRQWLRRWRGGFKIHFGVGTNSVNRLDVKIEIEGRVRNDIQILTCAAGWISHMATEKTGGMVWYQHEDGRIKFC